MPQPRLVDAVTLRHFGAINEIAILGARLQDHEGPHWTEAVYQDILNHEDEDECRVVLESGVLGNPHEVAMNDMAEVFAIRRALSTYDDHPAAHLGEAECILTADRCNGTFITDDYEAFAFAEILLGNNRVLDTVDIIREAVKAGDISAGKGKQVIDAIRNVGRHLRAGHPPTITEDYLCL